MAPSGLIPRSVIACAVLFAGYSAAIHSKTPNYDEVPESQASANMVTAEDLLYAESVPDVVIVGSSLAHRLRPAMFDGDVYNLAFGGRGVLDGLGMLERLHAAPRLVLIETNLAIRRPGDVGSNDRLFTPGLYQVRHFLPALRERHKPLHDLWLGVATALKWTRGQVISFLRHPQAGAHDAGDGAAVTPSPSGVQKTGRTGIRDSPVYHKMVERQVRWYSVATTPELTTARVSQLLRMVENLTERGSTVVLFEMPVYAQVCGSPAYIHTRAALAAAFPSERYLTLPSPDCARYQTTDGAHLDHDNAKRFADELTASLRRAGLWSGT